IAVAHGRIAGASGSVDPVGLRLRGHRLRLHLWWATLGVEGLSPLLRAAAGKGCRGGRRTTSEIPDVARLVCRVTAPFADAHPAQPLAWRKGGGDAPAFPGRPDARPLQRHQ